MLQSGGLETHVVRFRAVRQKLGATPTPIDRSMLHNRESHLADIELYRGGASASGSAADHP